MKFVSIITRAFNRLEYTIKCINSVRNNTSYSEYEHIIINNASYDGTEQWLDWIKKYIKWFPNVKPVHFPKNEGDWGGLIKGLNYANLKCGYIVQLDNDIEVEEGWLTKLVDIIENVPEKIVQLRRIGVIHYTPPKNLREINLSTGRYNVGHIGRPVGCFILSLEDFKLSLPYINIGRGGEGKTELSNCLDGTLKVDNLNCYLIEGKTEKNYVNHEKYGGRKNKAVYVKTQKEIND